MQHSRPILGMKTLILLPPTSYLFLFTLTTASSSLLSLFFLYPLTPSGFFNGILGVYKPGALNFYIFFRLIRLTLLVSRNLTLIHLPLSGSLDSLFCDLIAPSPGLAFSLLVPRTLATTSFFLSARAYLSRNFLPPLFLRLTSPLIM